VASSLLLATLLFTGATVRLDNTLYDTALNLRLRTPSPQIVLVTMDQRSLTEVGEWPWPRRVQGDLNRLIARDHPRAIGWFFIFATRSTPADDQAMHDSMVGTPTYVGSTLQSQFGVRATPPHLPATSAAAGDGAAEAQADGDGIVRHAFLFEGSRDNPRPTLALQLARRVGRGPLNAPSSLHATDPSNIVFRGGDLLIPYAGPPGTFKSISAATVLGHRARPGAFTGKLVLIGATAPNLLDSYPTPVSRASGMPNVEVQANILNAMLSGDAITPASRTAAFLTSLVMIWLMLTALLRLPPTGNLWLFVAMTGLPLFGAAEAVIALRVWMPPASFLVTQAIIVPYWGWRRLNATSTYLEEELRALESSVGSAVLGGARSTSKAGGDRVLQQMTLLQEAKKRVSDLRRFVADVLANFPDPVLVVDRDGRILTVNEAASEFAGRMSLPANPEAPIEPILARLSLLDRQAGPIWPPVERPQLARAASGLAPLTGMGPGGRAYEVRFTATRSAGDEPTGWIVHLADVTPLVSAMRQREEALQLLSHDMRSPQSAILATLSHPEFQGAPKTLRHRIEAHARRTLELADSFVRLAKAESSKYLLEPIDMGHLAQDAVEAVWPLGQAAKVAVELDLGGEEEFLIMADRGLLTRALINLLDNAVKFSPSGEKVVCRLRHARIDEAPAVACEIIDQAGGLGGSEAASLFQPFGSSKGPPRGTAGVGLGLAMVHTVVTRHSGEIVCDSTEGRGTVFTITLPLHDEVEVSSIVEFRAVS
jgi:CHASE2 domain-containing sensor protein/signal transduction histidine kinase